MSNIKKLVKRAGLTFLIGSYSNNFLRQLIENPDETIQIHRCLEGWIHYTPQQTTVFLLYYTVCCFLTNFCTFFNF